MNACASAVKALDANVMIFIPQHVRRVGHLRVPPDHGTTDLPPFKLRTHQTSAKMNTGLPFNTPEVTIRAVANQQYSTPKEERPISHSHRDCKRKAFEEL
jgi:hypothetical protein